MQADVAIIGYGPAGASLANLLGQAGFKVLVYEREAAIYPLPRAIHFDGEVMRVFHSMGLKTEIEAATRPGNKNMDFVNANNQVMLTRGGASLVGPHGSANNHYFHQPELEAVLRRGVARFANVSVFTRHEVFAIARHQDHALLSVENMANGSLSEVRARYVIGCDGARSLVRRLMGSTMEDLGLHQPWLVFDALLKRPVPHLPGYTVQHCDPVRPATYCHVVGNRRRWEIMILPGDDVQAIARPDQVWKLVERWIAPDDADIERAVVYTFHSVLARGWRRGRLMIAGDAAHQTPPFLGQGMCAGIRDAANLAWKLAAVLRGEADDSLLDTYESERLPHVRAFIDLAVRLGDIIQTTDPTVAAERDRKFANAPEVFSFPQPGLGPGLLEPGTRHAGSIFPQPRLADGRLLDEALGSRFGMLVRPGFAATPMHDSCVLTATPGDALDAALEALDVAAVLLRPDRYIFGSARDAAGIARLQQALGEQLLAPARDAVAA